MGQKDTLPLLECPGSHPVERFAIALQSFISIMCTLMTNFCSAGILPGILLHGAATKIA